LRNAAAKRRDARAERRKRRPTTIIVAHERIENNSREARTARPTTPVCWNAVQSCTCLS